VDDILAEYAAGAPAAPLSPASVREAEDDEGEREGWRRTVGWIEDASGEIEPLLRIEREVRLAVDPLERLEGEGPLDAADLHRRIRWVLRVEQGIAWHECRLLRLMADLKLYQRLGFRSLRQYSTEALGGGGRRPWGAVALARDLDRFPKVAAAFRRGLITALEATEICRVARGDTQDAWIARASCSTLTALREDVAFVLTGEEESGFPPERPLGGHARPCSEPVAGRHWVGAGPERSEAGDAPRVQTCAPGTSDVVVVPLARRVEGWYSAFGDDPRAVAEAMISDLGRKRPVIFFAPEATSVQWDLTVGHLRIAAGKDMGPSDSQCVALLLLNFLGVWADPRLVKRSRSFKVLARDGWRCQAPRCRSRAHLHAHHIIFRSRHGPDTAWNLVTVCAAHHRMIHAGLIRVRGRAPCGLEWAMGVNAAGDVRERFRNGTRVECDAFWSARDRVIL
jgi:hypothetical protein